MANLHTFLTDSRVGAILTGKLEKFQKPELFRASKDVASKNTVTWKHQEESVEFHPTVS